MMTTCHCIERWHIDQVLKSLPYHHVIPTYFPQIANQWKNKTLQSKQFQSLVSPIGLVTPIKIVHHWKLCIILFLGKKWTFCRISVLSYASFWADFRSCWIISLLDEWPLGMPSFEFPFAFCHSTVPLPDLLIQVVWEVFRVFPRFLLLFHQDRLTLGVFVLGYRNKHQNSPNPMQHTY